MHMEKLIMAVKPGTYCLLCKFYRNVRNNDTNDRLLCNNWRLQRLLQSALCLRLNDTSLFKQTVVRNFIFSDVKVIPPPTSENNYQIKFMSDLKQISSILLRCHWIERKTPSTVNECLIKIETEEFSKESGWLSPVVHFLLLYSPI